MTVTEKLQTIADNQQNVFDAGAKAEYDRFWDSFQQNGELTAYAEAFYGTAWNKRTFKPKYSMRPANAYNMFNNMNSENAYEPFDLVEHLAALGITLDFSGVTSTGSTATGIFNSNRLFTRVGIIDLSSRTRSIDSIFNNCTELITIDKLIVSDKGVEITSNTFKSCLKLQNLTIEGLIISNIYLQYSPLTVDSMKSVISCLKNYAGTDEKFAYTIQFSDACWEALEASGPSPSGGTWKEYVMFDLGWNY